MFYKYVYMYNITWDSLRYLNKLQSSLLSLICP